MSGKYILVSDDEYCYTLDTESEDYKTIEDFEKQEFENAKKDGVDISVFEDDILQVASDKYWDWVYNSHLGADTCNDIMNKLYEENQELLRYKYLVKGLEELVGKYVEELISDWTNGELSDENDILRLGKWHSENGLSWEEREND